MNSESILAVKLDKKEKLLTVNIYYFYPELKRNRTEEITDTPHPDFMKAIMKLSPHLAKVFHSTDDKESLYTATGFKYSKDRHIIITGKMATDTGSVVGIATPAINQDEDTYGFEEDLSEDIANLCIEAVQLLNGSKLGVRQMTIDEQEGEEDEKEDLETGLFKSENNEGLDDEKDDPIDIPENDEFIFPDSK